MGQNIMAVMIILTGTFLFVSLGYEKQQKNQIKKSKQEQILYYTSKNIRR